MNRLLEEYVAEVRSAMRGMPADVQEEEVREVAQHLAALAEAHREMGAGASESAFAAVASFGDARVVGSSLRRAWWLRRTARFRETALAAAVFTAVVWGTHLCLRSLGAWPRSPVEEVARLLVGSAAAACAAPRQAGWAPAPLLLLWSAGNGYFLISNVAAFGSDFDIGYPHSGFISLTWGRSTPSGVEQIQAIGFDLLQLLFLLLSGVLAAVVGRVMSKERSNVQIA